jgi:hypothetical protein
LYKGEVLKELEPCEPGKIFSSVQSGLIEVNFNPKVLFISPKITPSAFCFYVECLIRYKKNFHASPFLEFFNLKDLLKLDYTFIGIDRVIKFMRFLFYIFNSKYISLKKLNFEYYTDDIHYICIDVNSSETANDSDPLLLKLKK